MTEDFEKRTQEVLEESAGRLDGRTRSRLTQARHAALAQLAQPARHWWRAYVPAGAAAAVAVLAVVIWSGGPLGPSPTTPVVSPVDDLELLADAEAQDFVDDGEDLEFYEWAAGEGGVVSDPKPAEPDAELLEFLGGIDEVNDETQDEDLTVVLAKTDIDTLEVKKPKAPVKEEKVSDTRCTRRAALVALFAVSVHFAASGRAHAETPSAVEAPAPTPWESLKPEEQKVLARHAERWNSLPAEQQQRLLLGTQRWLAMTPDQRERAQARFKHWSELTPEQRDRARESYHRFKQLPPEEQARVRENLHRLKKLTPEQRQRLRERWQNATPEERQRMLERRRQRMQRQGRPPG